MRGLSLHNIASACGGQLSGPAFSGEISAVTTDSRAVSSGCLFAAIPGERADGHDFIPMAFEKGAACVLAQRKPEGVSGCVILVPDTVAALQKIAAFYRRQFDIPVLGVTGSVGKTTAKELVASVLSRRFPVHKTPGNFNNDLGVPLTLFGLNESHRAAVVEMGISHPGDMRRLAETVRPDKMLYTVIGHAHLEFLKSRRGIFDEKTSANDYLPEDGTVFCNGDDDLLREMRCRQKLVRFGLGVQNDVRAEHIRALPDGGTELTIVCGARRIACSIPAYGEHMVYAALEGAAVGLEFGLTDEEIAAGIAAYVPAGSRARRITAGEIVLIDDCYNANPTSTASALRSLAAQSGRRVAILGDMLELGDAASQLHRDTGELAKSLGIEQVLCVGDEARHIAQGADGRHFESVDALIEALPELIRPGDTVLVKASRSIHFERITEALTGSTSP